MLKVIQFNCMREKGEVGVSAGAEGEEKKKTGKERGRKTKKLPKKAFKTGFIRAAATTGAWIITGGTNEGIMKLVGEVKKIEAFLKLTYNSGQK